MRKESKAKIAVILNKDTRIFSPFLCGRCEYPVRFDNKFCSSCGAELNWWWCCPECKYLGFEPTKWCSHCGTKLLEEDDAMLVVKHSSENIKGGEKW